MVFCNYCACDVDVEQDDANGFSCCIQCGRVLEDIAFSADITFQKDAAGESTVVGQFVNESGVARGIGRIHGGRVYAYQADSHEKAQQRGRADIAALADQLSIRPREELAEAAHRLYRIALQRGFTRGRRTAQVAAACLYLVCRQESKPFLLIDFSDAIQVNVFTLGAVFLQLSRLLRLEEHPTLSRPVDPSLYIHRFADRLGFGGKMSEVASTSMRLVASMKRDWIQTGRRPSGICGAALYVAAHVHGFERSKRQVVAVVHIGEQTLARRISEFTCTEAGGLTRLELEARMDAVDRAEVAAVELGLGSERPLALLATGCEHMGEGMSEPHFAHGMCRSCYLSFVRISGGVQAEGANPPAFEAARRKEALPLLALEDGDEEDEDEDEVASGSGAGGGSEASARSAIRDEMAATLAGEEFAPFASLLGQRAEALAPAQAPAPAGKPGQRRSARRSAQEAPAEPVNAGTTRQEAQAQRPKQPSDSSLAEAMRLDEPSDCEAATSDAPQRAQQPVQQQPAQQPQRPAEVGSGLPRGFCADALAIVPRAAAAGDPASPNDDHGPDTLSDTSDGELGQYLAEEAEVRCKEELWDMMNRDWVERQAAKKAALEAAEAAAAEQRAAMEAAAAAGVAYKRGRGRPLGSRSKPRPESNDPPAETAQEAVVRALHQQRLSSKINYSALAELFENDEDEEAPAGDGAANEITTAAIALDEQNEGYEAERRRYQRQMREKEEDSKRRKTGGGSLAPSSMGFAAGAAGVKPALAVGRRVSGLGSLKDTNFASQMMGLGGSRDGASRPGSKGKQVRFMPGTRP